MLSLTPPPGKVPGSHPSPEQRPTGVTVSASAPLGLVLLALLLGMGPANRPDAVVDGGTLFAAGLLGAVATFAALTLAEYVVARRARSLGLEAGTVVVSGWGPAARSAEPPRTWQQARSLGRLKPLVTLAGGAGLLLIAAAAAGAGWTPLAATLVGAGLLSGALALLDLLPAPGRSGGLIVLARAWRHGDRKAGELAVARSGIRTGWGLVALGMLLIVVVGLAGLWVTFVGWLTLMYSRYEQARVSVRAATARVPASAAMTSGAPEVAGWHTVETVLAEVGPTSYPVLPLRRFDGTLEAVSISDLLAVPGDDRDLRRAQDFARPAVLLRPDEPVERLLDTPGPPVGLVVDEDAPQNVVEPGVVVLGVVGPAELARATTLGAAGGPSSPWSTHR